MADHYFVSPDLWMSARYQLAAETMRWTRRLAWMRWSTVAKQLHPVSCSTGLSSNLAPFMAAGDRLNSFPIDRGGHGGLVTEGWR